MKFDPRRKGTRFLGAAASLFGSSENEQVIDAIQARVAVVDLIGRVRAINALWRAVAASDDFFNQTFDCGLNYLDLCDSTRGINARAAWSIAKGLRGVLNGSTPFFSTQYTWQFANRRQTFKCVISSLGGRTFGSSRNAVIMHLDVDESPHIDAAIRPDSPDVDVSSLAARMEAMGADSAKNIGMIANVVPVLLSYVDANLIYRAVNNYYEEWFGAPAADIVGMSMSEVAGEALFRRVKPHVITALGGYKVSFEDLFENALGGQRWFRSTYVPDIDANGRVHGFCTFTYDISPIKEAQHSLAEARNSAEKGYRSQIAFLSNVGNELKGPLTSIIGFSQTLVSELFGPIGEQYHEYSNAIRDTACGLVELVSDLGDLSLIQSGQLALDEARLDLGTLIAASLPRAVAAAEEANAKLDIHLPRKAVGLFVDERLVRLVIVNLLVCGIRLADKGGQVKLSIHRESDGGLAIIVADADLAISQSDLDRIVEPFGHVEHPRTPGAIGAGLALPLAKHFMELHNGTLILSCGPKKGFFATATFPRARVVE